MPRPPEYGYKQEGPVQFQWVTRRSILSGDSFFGNLVTIYPEKPANHTLQENVLGKVSGG